MITVSLGKAKAITHNKRREVRDRLFQPLDVQATIPMYAKEAEAKRQAIREEFEVLQKQIDDADCIEKLTQTFNACMEKTKQ